MGLSLSNSICKMCCKLALLDVVVKCLSRGRDFLSLYTLIETLFHMAACLQTLSFHQVVTLTICSCCNVSLFFCSRFLVTPALSFQKDPISYSLLINPSSLFSIDQESGEISLTHSLDYETDQHRYLLLVRASENKDSLSSAAEVRLSRTEARMSQIKSDYRIVNI